MTFDFFFSIVEKKLTITPVWSFRYVQNDYSIIRLSESSQDSSSSITHEHDVGNVDEEKQNWYNGIEVSIDTNPEPLFEYDKFHSEAVSIKSNVLEKLDRYLLLEEKKGVISSENPDGSKHIVDIYDENGKMIGKLVYIGQNVHQLVEYEKDKMDGVNVFFNIRKTPHKIYHFKNGKLNGPFFQFIKRGDHEGVFISYIEYKDGNFEGKKLAWTLDQKVIKGSMIVTTPVPALPYP